MLREGRDKRHGVEENVNNWMQRGAKKKNKKSFECPSITLENYSWTLPKGNLSEKVQDVY